MDIRLKYVRGSNKSVLYRVFVKSEEVEEVEYCLCEMVFNFHAQREQKAVRGSGSYDLVGIADIGDGSALRLDGMSRRMILPNRALKMEPDDGAYYFYILGDRVRHCINKTITGVIRNELIKGRKVKIAFEAP